MHVWRGEKESIFQKPKAEKRSFRFPRRKDLRSAGCFVGFVEVFLLQENSEKQCDTVGLDLFISIFKNHNVFVIYETLGRLSREMG